jgi:mono/diheme cytochrome c family protein
MGEEMFVNRAAIAAIVGGLWALVAMPVAAQTEDRAITFGREIFKEKAACQFCHKWDGGGDQGYGGLAPSLRATKLDKDQITEVVRCGRPGTGMPYHDSFAYTDKRCYGVTRSDLGAAMPIPGNFLARSEVEAVVEFVVSQLVGKGPADYAECVKFWGSTSQQCDSLKK